MVLSRDVVSRGIETSNSKPGMPQPDPLLQGGIRWGADETSIPVNGPKGTQR